MFLRSRCNGRALVAATALTGFGWCGAAATSAAAGQPPNILFIVYDDVGIDQIQEQPFGWSSDPLESARMPVLGAIAAAGVSFTNFWATPECSPSRASFITGRWGNRTGVRCAIIDPMLPACQLNPAEITLPQVLETVGYTSAMIGKYHMAGDTNPAGPSAPAVDAKFHHYDGNLVLPPSIDTSVGGQVDPASGDFPCGAPTVLTKGAACFPDLGCLEGFSPFDAFLAGGIPLLTTDRSGNPTLALTCEEADCSLVSFDNLNAYYAWQRTIVDAMGNAVQLEPYREFMTTEITDRAVEWINGRGDGPWMCSVTYTASHTPLQTPPPLLLPTGTPIDFACDQPLGQHEVFRLMSEVMDRESGRLLAELGLGSYDARGNFTLTDPALTNTLIAVIGDNGSFAPTVLSPFNPQESKGTVFQTGVWVPLVVAGPMVGEPGRSVGSMVNVVDLFGLFSEVGGADLSSIIPPYRTIDSQPMLPYLTNPAQAEIRDFDFAMYAPGVYVPGSFEPCLLGMQCVDNTMRTESFCNDQGGTWYGGQGYDTCCELIANGILPLDTVLPPQVQFAVRKGRYKLVVLTFEECAPVTCSIRFYQLPDFVPPDQPGIESCGDQLCLETLDGEALEAFTFCRDTMIAIIQSEPVCLGDGNLDRRIDSLDVDGVLNSFGMGPSYYDFNADGQTDGADLGIVLANWTQSCRGNLHTLPPCLADPPLGNIPDDQCAPCE
jgi:arylsulfatase A-like enzyme